MAYFFNANDDTLISGTNDDDTIQSEPIDHNTCIIYCNGGNDFVSVSGNYGILWSESTISGGYGNDSICIYGAVDGIHPSNVNIDSGAGNDFVSIYGGYSGIHGGTTGLTAEEKTSVSLGLGDGNDSLFVVGLNHENSKGIDISKVTISGGKGDDFISVYGSSSDIGGWANYGNATVTIDGGNGSDTISVNSIDEYGDVTIIAGENDFISVESGSAHYLFDNTEKVNINGAIFESNLLNDSAILQTESNSITLNNGWSGTIQIFDGLEFTDTTGSTKNKAGIYFIVDGIIRKNSWKLSGTTATYGTSSETLVTVKGVKSLDGLSLNDKVVTVANSSLINSKVTISNGYTLKLASDVTKSSTKKAAWSYSNSTATYKGSSKTAGYTLASNKKSISYTKATSAKTLATIKGAKSKKGLSLSGKKISLKNTALKNKVTVSGSYGFDFAAGYKNATIAGTAKADTITARGSNVKIVGGKGKDSLKMVGTNQTLSGGAGADTFIYAASGGKERITDFQSNDILKIGVNGDGIYSTVTSGDNLIVSTDDGGKITLVGAASLSNVDIVGTKKTSGKGVKVSGNGKKITLTSDYSDDSFSLSGKYSSAVTVDASAALLELSITGNNFSNRIIGTAQDDTIDGGKGADTIYGGDGSDSILGGKGDDELHGGEGDDTLWGGTGNDELYGENGTDVFYYNTGEGNDTIFGYEATVDKIILASGTVSNVTSDRNNNVIFKVGSGQILVAQGADRAINIYNPSGKILINYEP